MPRGAYVEPTSRLAVWSLRFTVLGAATMLLTPPAALMDWIDGNQAIAALAVGAMVVAVGLALALTAGVVIWFSGYRGARFAVAAGLLAALFLAYPVAIGLQGFVLPRINDITTDPDDPPAFDVVASVRPASANPTAYPREFYALQRAAYPGLRALEIDLPPEDVNEILSEFVANHRWRVLDQADYRGPQGEGRIELVARSLLFGFRDDIVLRARTVGGRTRIDMRSASRYGRHDFGVNARRVDAALEELRVAARRAQAGR